MRRLFWILASVLLLALAVTPARAQTVLLAGLRSLNHRGAFHGLKADASGNLFTLFDANDGVRLLKFSADGTQLLAQTQIGQAGDTGIALDVDDLGFIAVTGISTSTGSVSGTAGTAFPNRADSTTNSFVARFTPKLTLQWLSCVGSGKTAAVAVASNSSTVYVTGGIYAATLPVTSSGVQQAPAPGSSGNGFVEAFDATNGSLTYATYLTGAHGDTQPVAMAVDSGGNAYIVGATSATGYPTLAALVPVMRYAGSLPVSGFVTKLTPAGDGFAFSTFVPGNGLTSVALDAGNALLLSGNISSGLFPVTVAQSPIATKVEYQSAIRLALDGSQVLSSTLLAPGNTSVIVAGSNGQSWVFTSSSAMPPLLPLLPLESIGDASAFRIASSGKVDRDARLGGVAVRNSLFANAPITIGGIAVTNDGTAVLAGALTPTVSSSLLSTQTFDVPLVQAPNAALPSTVRDAFPLSACGGSSCTGGAGLMVRLAPDASVPQLSLSVDNHPNLTLRNLGTADATNVQISASGTSIVSTCDTTLPTGAECSLALTGSSAGSITVQAGNVPPFTTPLPMSDRVADAIAVTPRAFHFGIVTAGASSAAGVLTVHNFSATAQTFASQRIDTAASPYTITETATTCAPVGDGVNFVVQTNGTCTLTLTLAPSASSGADTSVAATWQVGTNDVSLTGYAQVTATSLAATTIDFGRQFQNSLRAPRFLYISNASDTVQAHASVVSTASVFTVTDECPTTLQPHSVCRIALNYLSAVAPSSDAFSLVIDGTSVTVMGETLPPPSIAGATVNPNLSVSAQTVLFTDPVTVTTASTMMKTVTVSNTGTSPFALTFAVAGDFTFATNCPAALPGATSCGISVTFTPSAAGARQGLLSVAAGSAGPVYVALTGTGSAIFSQNNGVSLGDIPLHTPAVLWLKVQQALMSATVTSPDSAYKVILVEDIGYGHGQPSADAFLSNTTGSCLNCWLGIQFTPVSVGSDVASISFGSSPAGKATSLVVSGNGVPLTGLILTPLIEDFGPIAVSTTSASTLFQLTNATSAPVTTSGASVSGDFAISKESTGTSDCSATTLSAGASCVLAVRFTPTALGTRGGLVSVQTASGTAFATLAGTGVDDSGISFLPGELRFDNVPGQSATLQTITLTNTSTSSEVIGTPISSDSHFTVSSDCSNLAAGASCVLTVMYSATDSLSAGTLTVPVTSAPAGAASTSNFVLALTGRYTSETAGLQIVPGEHSTVHFGVQATGTISSARVLHVNNLSSQALTLHVTSPREFAVMSSTCGALAANGSCDMTVQFTPLTTGDTTGTVFLQGTPSDGSATRDGLAYLEGYGQGAEALSVIGKFDITGVLGFGQVSSGQSVTQTLTLTNPANAAATVTVRRILSEAPFLTTTTCGQALAPGQSCTVTATYAPTFQIVGSADLITPRLDTSSITIQTDAADAPLLVDLAGQVVPKPFSSQSNGGSLQTINVSQGSLSFTNTSVGSASPAQTIQVANTGTVSVHILGVTSSRGFAASTDCGTLLPGGTCSANVSYQPQTAGILLGALEIQSDSVSSLEFVSLVGTGSAASVSLAPQNLDFGRVLVGRNSVGAATLTNTGSAPVTVSGITVAGTGFSLASTSGTATQCATTGMLQAGASCAISLVFSPTSSGTQRGTVYVATTATALPLTVALSGVGTQPKLTTTPSSLSFGNVAPGSSTTLWLTVRNVSNVAVNGLSFFTTSSYTVASTCGPTTLTAGSSCAVSVTFNPTSTGPVTGGLTITSDDPASPIVVPLSGTATAPVPSGSFTLTVNGGSSGATTVQQGVSGTYSLAVTPVSGFTGPVALTCLPDTNAQYAACSLLPSVVTLSSGAQASIATITTVTAVPLAQRVRLRPLLFACLLPAGLALLSLRRRSASLLALLVFITLSGCGSGGDPRIRYTPAGTYTFQVTASSANGAVVAQTVPLTLVVKSK